MFKRIKSSVPRVIPISTWPYSYYISRPTPILNGSEFDADPITPNNWDGGIICKYVRKSKKQVWAFRMWLPEGFTIIVNGKKIRGNPGNWLIIDDTQKYIVTERMFRKKYRKVNDER